MELLNFRCPNCGGSVAFEENAETATCNFCGATLHFQNEIEKLQRENKGKIDRYTERIVALIQCQKFIQAEKLIEEALLDCPYAGTLYVFRLLCELGLDDPAKLATYGKDYTTSENFKKSVRFLTGQDKEDLLSMAKQNERLLSPATDSTPSQANREPDPFKALFEPGSNALSDAISLAVAQKPAEKFADDEDEDEDDDEEAEAEEKPTVSPPAPAPSPSSPTPEEPRTYSIENAKVYVENIKNNSSLDALQKIRKITVFCGVDFVKLMIFNGVRPSFLLLPETSPRIPELGEDEDFFDFCIGYIYNLEIDDLMEEVEKNRTAYSSLTEEFLEELRLALYIKKNIMDTEDLPYIGIITEGIERKFFDSEEAYRDAVHRHLLFLHEYLETVVLRLKKIRPETAFRGSTEDLIRAGEDPVFYEEKFIRPLIVEQTAAIATYTKRIFPGFAVRRPYLWVDTLSPDIFRREQNDIMEELRAENEQKKLEYELGGLGLFNIRRKIEIYRKLNEIKKTNQINRYQTELMAIGARIAAAKDDLAKLEGAPAEEVRQAKEAVDRTPLTAFARRRELKTVYDAKRNAYEEKKNRLDSVLKTQAEKQKMVEKELARTEKTRFLL